MDRATLPSIPWIRTLDNEVIGDILYYFSTYHGHQMLSLVTQKLNTAYSEFTSRHGDEFLGRVNLIAHSLGGLVCYEILYYMHKLAQARERGVDVCELIGAHERERYRGLPELAFSPDRLFTMGAPLGGTMVFRHLSLREFVMARGVGFHNIFHPYDPFGYRTEPLADACFADTPAVPITNASIGSGSDLTPPMMSNSSLSRFGTKRMSLGGSMADLRKSFVGAMTSVSISVVTGHRRRLSLAGGGGSVTSAESDGHRSRRRRRRSSFSRLLPSLQSFSWLGHSRHQSESSVNAALEETGIIAEEPAEPQGLQEPSTAVNEDEDEDPGSSTPDSLLSFSCTPHIATTISATTIGAMEGAAAGGSSGSSSQAAQSGTARDDDDMMSHIMRIFAVSRTPTREQQLAESQGLPLASRLMAARAVSTAPADRPVHSAHARLPAPAPAPADPAGNLGLRKCNTMPPAIPEAAAQPLPASRGPSPEPESPEATPPPTAAAAEPEHQLPYAERMDYIIPFTKGHLQNEYWLGFQAHFSYWTSKDVVYHILHHMVRNPISPNSSEC
ncbi:hypothetical protein H4R26_002101 [Coemansia thaxteri]|uniref:DDHD domain-containing protein n=1 Tax=Coemansia thaxteri TaxID=2663907 RepID=A0A9W8BF85_9FUNG|nr:hypothetical protein H4R26_002101 [Coemansia thaxteri]